MTKLKKVTKHWKKISLMFTFACMLFFIPSITAKAYTTTNGNPNDSSATVLISGYCGDHAEYVLYSNWDLFITGYGDMFDFYKRDDLDGLPYGYTPWSKYLKPLFYDDLDNYPKAIHVYIDADISSIGAYAFYSVDHLSSVTFESGSKCNCIGTYAFRDNPRLTSINFPSTVKRICAFAFCDTGLTSITLPNALTYIEDYAFADTELKSITLPKNVKYLYNNAFSSCESLTSADLSKCKAVDLSGTFYGCTALKSVSLPNTLKVIGSSAFTDTNLTSITIPSNVTKIKKDAFSYIKHLKTVTIKSKKLTSVESNVLKCSNSKLIIKVPGSKYSAYKKLFTSKTGYKTTMKIKKI